MVCIIDLDKTFLVNDFFKESFYRNILGNPFSIFWHFFRRGTLLQLKMKLLKDFEINYPIDQLINPIVNEWIINNRLKYDKLVMISASPDFFVKRIISPLEIFDEIHGSTDVNLKGKKKLKFIQSKFKNEFCYIGDSKDDFYIFEKAKESYLVKNNHFLIKN